MLSTDIRCGMDAASPSLPNLAQISLVAKPNLKYNRKKFGPQCSSLAKLSQLEIIFHASYLWKVLENIFHSNKCVNQHQYIIQGKEDQCIDEMMSTHRKMVEESPGTTSYSWISNPNWSKEGSRWEVSRKNDMRSFSFFPSVLIMLRGDLSIWQEFQECIHNGYVKNWSNKQREWKGKRI